MQWLLHGWTAEDAQAIAAALTDRGDQIHLPAEAGLADQAPAEEMLRAAQQRQWGIFTADPHLAAAPLARRVHFDRCLVYLRAPVAGAVERLFERYARLSPGRLYTIAARRVKVRQLPGRKSGL